MFVQRISQAVRKRPKKVYSFFAFGLLLLLGSSFLLSSLIIKGFHAHASPVPSPSVSKTWYFAEGRVGAGFREYLTISNPDPSIDCTTTIEYLPEGVVTAHTRAHAVKPLLVKTLTIPHASRTTVSVNSDLGITEQQNPGQLLSAVVTVPNAASCLGIVVERPMYFTFRGVTSGSDVVGATALSSSFFFADVPTSVGSTSFVTSFLSILNPSATSTASITATYYAAGNRVGTQTISVAPGGRGTLTPGQLSLPTHVAATVTSDQPVVVERSIYRYKISEGTAGVVSSASAVIGSQALSDHWLFAEGYANKQSQENLVLSNLSANATTATITLEYQNGHNQTLTTIVAPFAQNVLNVNQANANPTGTCDTSPCSPTPEVSADVTSTSASLVVERQMFFHYTHTLPRTSVNVTAVGGADVQGTTSAATSSVNFAEGYTNKGYNEWLTLQNPTANSETLLVTLHNEYGRTYTQNVQIGAKTRSTVDITDLVRSHLLQAGDDFKAYQVSMNVQTTSVNETFVAERPMYFQLSEGIQGGTDVVGFVGASPLPLPTPSPTTAVPTPSPTTAVPTPSPTTAVPTPSPTPAPQPYITEYSNGLTASSDLRGITKGPDGNVWFNEDDANKTEYITPDATITGFSTGETGTYPGDITTGSDGNLWFGHSSITSIGRMTPTGTVTEFPVTGFSNSNLYGITAGPDGNVWFTMVHDTKIGRITPDGTITEFSTGLTANAYPLAIIAGSDGNLWFTEHEANQIGRITPTGTITEFSTGLTANSGPWGITKGPDGNLWFTENTANKIGRITPTGTITEFSTGLTANSGVQDITAGADGSIWFIEHSANKIGRVNLPPPPAPYITEYNNGLTASSNLQGITAGPDGNVWFTEAFANKIAYITPDATITENSTGEASGQGGTVPNFITRGSDGNLWFGHSGTNTIGRMTPSGTVT